MFEAKFRPLEAYQCTQSDIFCPQGQWTKWDDYTSNVGCRPTSNWGGIDCTNQICCHSGEACVSATGQCVPVSACTSVTPNSFAIGNDGGHDNAECVGYSGSSSSSSSSSAPALICNTQRCGGGMGCCQSGQVCCGGCCTSGSNCGACAASGTNLIQCP